MTITLTDRLKYLAIGESFVAPKYRRRSILSTAHKHDITLTTRVINEVSIEVRRDADPR